jgi:hypothetical protein
MRVTHATRCTAVLTPGTTPSFWQRGLFWSKAAFDASPNLRKQLMTTAIMAALGFTFATSTSQPPGTVIGSDGTLQYGAHNLLLYSEDLSTWWIQQSVAITTNVVTAPNGILSADKLAETAGGTGHYVWRGDSYTGQHTISVYAKAAERSWLVINYYDGADRNTWFDLANGVVGTNAAGNTSTIVPVGNGWYRCTVSRTTGISAFMCYGPAPADNTSSYSGVAGSGIYLWGMQINKGVLVDYVSTNGSAIYAPRQTYDRGASSNFAYNTEDCSLWGLSSAVTASGLAFTETVENTSSHQIGQFAANITGTFLLTVEVKIPASRGVELLTEHSSGGHYIKWTAAGVATLQNWGTPTGTGSLQEAYVLPDGYIRLTVGVAGASATFTRVCIRAIDNTGSEFYTGSTSATFLYRNLSLQRAQYRGAYLRTTSTAPLYAAGTPKSQNLISNSTVPIAGAGSNTTDAVDGTTGYRKITSPGAGAYNFEPAITTVSGCVYVAQFSLYATGTSSSATIFANGSGGGLLTSTVASGPGAITGGDATNPRITGLSQSVPTVVQVTWLGQKILSIYPTATGGGSSSGGEALLVTAMQANEGSVLLPYVATTGTPYSLYYQRSIVRENAATRETLQPRDLTQAAWGKNTTTVTKDQTGIDGVANSACKVVSGAAGSTVYQGVTSASANRVLSFYARSISATTVTVGIKANAGSTYTDVVVTPQWQRFTVAEASITNPVYAIKFYANGDSIAIDFVQGEQGTFATSPIWGTESAAQTRSADLIRPPASYVSDAGPQSTVIAVIAQSATSGAGQILLGRSGNGFANYLHSSGKGALYDSTNLTLGPTVVPVGVPTRVATRYSGSAAGVCTDGGSISTGTFDGSMGTAGATPGLGDDGGGGTGFAGEILSLEIATTVANDATLQVAALGLAA